ncbi:MAG TPA: N-carbamoyl-L-amino acid amidohydrolase [Gammaproteobacteria bacterium]|nr:N-carbamoyl-L-amino acid amidohydrolase [Gammaproteobacteria bacterium]
MKSSPYLQDNQRLADVIAAIQVMGTYKYYKLDFAAWSDRINGDAGQAEYWKHVFEQHPEFFRLDSRRERASLVWRRQHQKLFNVDTEEKITRREYKQLSDGEKQRISRTPLTSNELATLIQAAIDLHSRALERKRDSRWWVAGVFGLIGVVLGALVNAWAG